MWAYCTYFGHSRPTYIVSVVGPHNLWALTSHIYYSTCEPSIYIGPTNHVCPQNMLTYYTCGPIVRLDLMWKPTIHVCLPYMWDYKTCGQTIHVGPQYVCSHNTCGHTINVGLLYMWVYNMWTRNTCGPSIKMGPQFMWADNLCGPTINVGPEYIWVYYTCGPPRYLGIHYM